MSSITCVLNTAAWKFFTTDLPRRFSRSRKVVVKAIMTDINDLVQEFWRTSSDKAVGASIFPLRHLLRIFQDILRVCFVVFVFATAVD